jgi:hypothetical protein
MTTQWKLFARLFTVTWESRYRRGGRDPAVYLGGFVIFEVAFTPPSSGPVDPLDMEGIYTYRAEPAGTDD